MKTTKTRSKKMRVQKQPENSKLCGQYCLATVIGIPVEEVIAKIGHKHGTKTKELVKVLRKYKIKCSAKLKLVKSDGLIPLKCIIKLKSKKSHSWHWMVFAKDKIWDPLYGTTYPIQRLCEFYITPCSISSYLEILD